MHESGDQRGTNQGFWMEKRRYKISVFNFALRPFSCVHRRELPEPLAPPANVVVDAVLVEPQLGRVPVRGEGHRQHGPLREIPQERLAPAERLGDELCGAGHDDEPRGAAQLAERERPAARSAGADAEPELGQALLPREPGHLGVLGLALARVEEGEERDGRDVDAQALERVGRPRGVGGQRREEPRERDEAPQRAAGHEGEVEEHPHRPERGEDLTPYLRHGAAATRVSRPVRRTIRTPNTGSRTQIC